MINIVTENEKTMKLRLLYQAKAFLFLPIGCMFFLIHPQSSFADHETLQNSRYDNLKDVRLEVILNENSSAVYADIHIQKWGKLEDYFKASNYFDLIVSH